MPIRPRHRKVRQPSYAWARLNSDGWLLVGLLIFSTTDLLHPDSSNMARLVGEPPPFEPVWLMGFGLSGLMISAGFVTARTTVEIAGRLGFGVCLVIQTVVVASLLGWTDLEAVVRVALCVFILFLTWLRVTTLLSPDGITVTIPGRDRLSGDE